VAEVNGLRNRLLKDDYIKIFRQLLFTNDGIEIPYNSAGVLVHILSDGQDEWNKHMKIERNSIINDLRTIIDSWDIKTERNINYRSFEPILRLAINFSNPICQHWSCWALANLTTVYRKLFFFVP
jgi:Zyg-11 family protein